MLSPPAFHTARLVYRAIDPKKDVGFITDLYRDPATFCSSMANVCQPISTGITDNLFKWSDSCLLSVIVCLPKSAEDQTTPGDPIGWIVLNGMSPNGAHHRKTSFGLTILNDYHGKGYGPEALEWLLEQAFVRCGLHKVEGEAFGWNEPALKTYRKLGFVQEGIKRKSLWQEGEFRDEVLFGMLDEEWKAIQAQKKAAKAAES